MDDKDRVTFTTGLNEGRQDRVVALPATDDDLSWGDEMPISMAEANRPVPPLSAWHHIKVVLCVGIIFAFLAYMMYLEH